MTDRSTPRLCRLASACAVALGLAAPLLLAGCAGPVPADYASQAPKLDLKQYFNGKLLAHGIVTSNRMQAPARCPAVGVSFLHGPGVGALRPSGVSQVRCSASVRPSGADSRATIAGHVPTASPSIL